jgi:hypothetical protein
MTSQQTDFDTAIVRERGEEQPRFDGRNKPERPEFGQRLNPALDPQSRRQLARRVKWMMALGVIALAYYTLSYFYPAFKSAGAGLDFTKPWLITSDQLVKLDAVKEPFFVAIMTITMFFATIVARFIAGALTMYARIYPRYREAVEALRDWIVAGGIAGLFTLGFIAAIKAYTRQTYGQQWIEAIRLENLNPHKLTPEQWHILRLYEGDPGDDILLFLQYRAPLMLVATLIGVLLARLIAIKHEPNRGPGIFVFRILVQSVITVAIYPTLNRSLDWLVTNVPWLSPASLVAGSACIAVPFGVLIWAALQDRAVQKLQQDGVRAKAGDVALTVTVIGGRESGKTTFLLGSYHEWTSNPELIRDQEKGSIVISPVDRTDEGLSKASDALYGNSMRNKMPQLPPPTRIKEHYLFDLFYDHDSERTRIARFNYLDYPGSVATDESTDAAAMEAYWRQISHTDALIIVVDMACVRAGIPENEFRVLNTGLSDSIDKILQHNGRRRVVPVCFVLTKCDEYADEDGRFDFGQIMTAFENSPYGPWPTRWAQKSDDLGPRVNVQQVWPTSAVKYSVFVEVNGQPDRKQKKQVAPPPRVIMPVNCAAPLLWLSAKTLQYNITLAWDIQTLILGSNKALRRQEDAIDAMETIANTLRRKIMRS